MADYYGADFTLKVERYKENGKVLFTAQALEENAGDIEVRGSAGGNSKQAAMFNLYDSLKAEYKSFKLTLKSPKGKEIMTWH